MRTKRIAVPHHAYVPRRLRAVPALGAHNPAPASVLLDHTLTARLSCQPHIVSIALWHRTKHTICNNT